MPSSAPAASPLSHPLPPAATGIITPLLTVTTSLALLVPMNLAFNLPPSATVLNQAAAWLGWGMVAALLAVHPGASLRLRNVSPGARALMAVLALVACAALLSPWWTGLPGGLALSISATLLATVVLVHSGAASASGGFGPSTRGAAVVRALCWGLLAAGTVAACIGVIQVFAPTLADGDWIASTSVAGRAAGNLRQPNHLASLLLWSMIAAVWCFESAPRPSRWKPLAAALFGFLLFGIVLTASRTGVVGVLLLALWGLADRQRSRPVRGALLLAPLLYVAMWFALGAATQSGAVAFSGAERLQQSESAGSRLAIWSNALALLRAHPWTGVGPGELNFAWTLTELAQRPTEFFDHTHNLPLQLLVELGLPLGSLVLALLLYALWRAFVAARDAQTPHDALARRCLLMVLLMAALHSQFEYPLWYAHFLFPVALIWGLCLGEAAAGREPARARARIRPAVVAALLVFAGGLVMLADYRRVVSIFAPSADAPPLADRLEAGRRSLFFSHHADYALVTIAREPGEVLEAFGEPVHYLLDTRLMMAWARALAARGDVDRARWVAARLAEFRRPEADAFFAPCAAGTPPRPFQCEPPERRYSFEDFR